jgi:hypothetical protein
MGYAAQVFDPLPVAVFSPFRQSIGKIANLQVPPVEYRRIQTRFKNPAPSRTFLLIKNTYTTCMNYDANLIFIYTLVKISKGRIGKAADE